MLLMLTRLRPSADSCYSAQKPAISQKSWKEQNLSLNI